MNASLQKSCCFISDIKICSDNYKEVEDLLLKSIEELINSANVSSFYFTDSSEFDDLAYSIVTRLKIKHPNLSRICIIGTSEDYSTTISHQKTSHSQTKAYEEFIILSDIKRKSILRLSQIKLKKSNYCLIYKNKDGSSSGISFLVDYANEKKIPIILINN